MPVDPAIVPVLEAANRALEPDPSLPVEERRAVAHTLIEVSLGAVAEDPLPGASVEDASARGPGGEVPVRVYRPDAIGPHTVHLYLHGGGFWLGTLDHSDGTCRDLCARAGCAVVSVGYRLAPEHPFPAAPEDAYAALCWAVERGRGLGLDTSRFTVGGASAGGNLAAVVAMMARDRGGPPVAFQLLEIPVTDFTMSQPSVSENAEGYLLTRQSMEDCRAYYLRDTAEASDPYASPLLAPDLSGLPPALVMTAEMDPLRDEGEAYAERLQGSGVPAELVRWDGHVHGAGSFTRILPSARAYRDKAVSALRKAHGIQS